MLSTLGDFFFFLRKELKKKELAASKMERCFKMYFWKLLYRSLSWLVLHPEAWNR